MKRIINTKNAPAAVGPYSQAVEVNGTLYISGQIGLAPHTGKIVDGGIEKQTEQVLKNILAILEKAGFSTGNVVKTTCLLVNIEDFQTVNKLYGEVFEEARPARATYQVVNLPLGALIEIEAVAVR